MRICEAARNSKERSVSNLMVRNYRGNKKYGNFRGKKMIMHFVKGKTPQDCI